MQAPAGGGGVVLDAALVASVIVLAPTLVWPMAIALPASITRIGWTLHAFRPALTR